MTLLPIGGCDLARLHGSNLSRVFFAKAEKIARNLECQ